MTHPDAGPPEASIPADEPERIGPFPSWNALYVTVIVYAFGLIGLLTYLTVRLDFS